MVKLWALLSCIIPASMLQSGIEELDMTYKGRSPLLAERIDSFYRQFLYERRTTVGKALQSIHTLHRMAEGLWYVYHNATEVYQEQFANDTLYYANYTSPERVINEYRFMDKYNYTNMYHDLQELIKEGWPDMYHMSRFQFASNLTYELTPFADNNLFIPIADLHTNFTNQFYWCDALDVSGDDEDACFWNAYYASGYGNDTTMSHVITPYYFTRARQFCEHGDVLQCVKDTHAAYAYANATADEVKRLNKTEDVEIPDILKQPLEVQKRIVSAGLRFMDDYCYAFNHLHLGMAHILENDPLWWDIHQAVVKCERLEIEIGKDWKVGFPLAEESFPFIEDVRKKILPLIDIFNSTYEAETYAAWEVAKANFVAAMEPWKDVVFANTTKADANRAPIVKFDAEVSPVLLEYIKAGARHLEVVHARQIATSWDRPQNATAMQLWREGFPEAIEDYEPTKVWQLPLGYTALGVAVLFAVLAAVYFML